jgi:hypothetical protein
MPKPRPFSEKRRAFFIAPLEEKTYKILVDNGEVKG